MLNGLPQQLDVIAATHAFNPLKQRAPKVMWRGRASDEPRDEVRCDGAARLYTVHLWCVAAQLYNYANMV